VRREEKATSPFPKESDHAFLALSGSDSECYSGRLIAALAGMEVACTLDYFDIEVLGTVDLAGFQRLYIVPCRVRALYRLPV